MIQLGKRIVWGIPKVMKAIYWLPEGRREIISGEPFRIRVGKREFIMEDKIQVWWATEAFRGKDGRECFNFRK